MNIKLVFYYILLLILLFLLALMFYYYYLALRKNNINKRLLKFTVYTNNDQTKLFDNFFNAFDRIIKYTSSILYKFKFFSKYSLKYQKYITKENREYEDKMDYVSRKLLLGLVFIIFVISIGTIKFETITWLQLLFAFLIGFYLLDIFLISKDKILKAERENDLLKAITIMNNSFKSGCSVMQSIKIVGDELDSPLGIEFQKMFVDLTYGLSIEVVFKRFEERVKLDDAKYITNSLIILNNTGGDIVKVFESVEKTFFNSKKLNDELKNLTAASKFLYYVLLFIPIIFTLIIYILDNSYFNPLFKSTLGYLILITCLIIYISYIVVVKRIMKVGDYH